MDQADIDAELSPLSLIERFFLFLIFYYFFFTLDYKKNSEKSILHFQTAAISTKKKFFKSGPINDKGIHAD